MTEITLGDLQASVRDTSAFNRLEDYYQLCKTFLELMQKMRPTRIISPTHNNYVFYQYLDLIEQLVGSLFHMISLKNPYDLLEKSLSESQISVNIVRSKGEPEE